MINNQLIPAGNIKTDLLTSQADDEKKNGESKVNAGLFKFLMGSIQLAEKDGEQGGDSGQEFSSDRILGGNLLARRYEGEENTPLKNILAGLEKKSIDELTTISELLENAMNSSISEEGLTVNGTPVQSEVKSDDNEDHEAKSNNSEGSEIITTDNEESELKLIGEQDSQIKTDGDQDKHPLTEGSSFHRDISEEKESVEISEKEGSGERSAYDNKNYSDEIAYEKDKAEIEDVEIVNESSLTEDSKAGEDPQITISPESASGADADSKESYEKVKVKENNSEKENLKAGTVHGAGKQIATTNVKLEAESSEHVKREAETPMHVNREAKTSGDNNRSDLAGYRDRDVGLVNQLRTIINGGPFGEIQQNDTGKTDLDSDDHELIQKMFADLANGSIDQQAAEVRSIKANQFREIRNQNYRSGFAGRPEVTLNSGSQTVTGSGVTAGSDPGKLSMVSISGVVPESSQVTADLLDEDASAMWKEHIAEYFESKEKNSADQSAALSRLNQVPVTNISVRRNFATSLGQSILHATGDGKKAAEMWQKHTFTLEGGKNIQLSAREADGVLQIKLSSSSSELQKLLMDHQDEIRKHLEEEVSITINLQLESQNDGQMTGHFGDSGSNQREGSQAFDFSNGKTDEQPIDEIVPKAVRNFGYNQMEWSA